MPREMTKADIAEVIGAWVKAAQRALAAGFEMLELHGAHGYLLHEFLSRRSNQPHRRVRRQPREPHALRARDHRSGAQRAGPEDKPLFFRVSAVDEGGWTLETRSVLARELKARGVDVIDCSSSGISIRSPTAGRGKLKLGFQVPYARATCGVTPTS